MLERTATRRGLAGIPMSIFGPRWNYFEDSPRGDLARYYAERSDAKPLGLAELRFIEVVNKA
jgi:hypothetical protein